MLLLFSFWLFIWPGSGLSRAAEPGNEQNYQRTLIQDSLTFQMLTPDPAPEGKTIERIIVVNRDVVTEHDPWPGFVNWIHATTDREIVEQELLFKVGDRWDTRIIEETSRNLRDYLLLSVAEVTAARGSSRDKVIALVTAKDLWSLRLNWNFSYVGSKLEALDAELAESNLAGRNKKLGFQLRYDLATTSIGQSYDDPRVLGSRVAFSQDVRFIGNRSQGKLEGGEAGFSIGKPLYSIRTEWAWSVSAGYLRDVYRLFSAGKLAEQRMSTGETVPYSFHREILNLGADVTRSFGVERKHDFSIGWRGFTRDFELPQPPLKPLSQASIDEFTREQLPFDQRAGRIFASYAHYTTKYAKVQDFETFALTEDVLLGPSHVVSLSYASPAFGFDSTFIQPGLSLGYTWLEGEQMITGGLSTSLRYQPQTVFESPWVDEEAGFSIKHYSPRFSGLRLVSGARVIRRIRDLDRSFSVLGGDSLLRGYPSSYFTGPNSWSANTELRTLPYIIQTVHMGAAAFVDMGDAYRDGEPIGLHASTGLGLRFLFPQFNRSVLRMDVGFPLESADDLEPMSISAEFGQAF